MTEIGFSLSSEEFGPNDLVRQACAAERAGFGFALISDHFHPWTDRQGQSPFAWSVIGAIAQVTSSLRLGTGVTCPLVRYHPALIAQAAATAGAMMPGRFFLGLGTGENLNEHIYGRRWPGYETRSEMLEEAVEVVRQLWQGGLQSHRGTYFTVENARIYSLPDPLPPIYLAAAGPESAELAGRLGDGLVSTAPLRSTVETFEAAGGRGKPRFGQLTVCWAKDEASARKTALEVWPTAAIHGGASQELPLPSHFEALAKGVTEDQVAERVTCGPDPERHVQAIQQFVDAGFDHVYVHQVGPDQAGMMDFYAREILPRFG